jgi:predicted adenine nucleotide alpha hydrolase (AANH) superfamily ATPase
MKLLLHICCAPCTIYPLKHLREQGMDIHGFFYNPNIHPYQEFQRRLTALQEYAPAVSLPLQIDGRYDMEEFLRLVVFREDQRCRFCYGLRLQAAALAAKQGNFDAFTATLLYSRFQKHEVIREIGEQIGQEVGVPFYYADFRSGWQEGISESKRLGMYRQNYCGCIYSEKERFYKAQPRQDH